MALTELASLGEDRYKALGRLRGWRSSLKALKCTCFFELSRLDHLSLPAPTTIKIDAEGHELEVLEGATAVIDSARPFIILENWLHHGKPRLTLVLLTLLSARRYCFFLPGGYAETPIAF